MIDAVIIDAEFQIESKYNPYGHFVALKFIDTIPDKPKLLKTIQDLCFLNHFVFFQSLALVDHSKFHQSF